MGYVRHDAVLVTISDHDRAGLDAIQRLKAELAAAGEYQPCANAHEFILGPVEGINGYTTVVLAPDGSKEGWPDSDYMDEVRERFIAAALESKWPRIIKVNYGGDACERVEVERVPWEQEEA